MGYFNDDEKLSRQIILDHYEDPENKIDENKISLLNEYDFFNSTSKSCIDNLTLYLKTENNIIIDLKFSGLGCAISTSSTDIFCSFLKNKTKQEAKKMIEKYFEMIEGNFNNIETLESLVAFKNISKQINRIKCAKIGVKAIKELINK